MCLTQAWSAYEADKRLLGYSHHTLRAYKLQVGLLIRHVGDINIQEVTFEQLKEYLGAQVHLKPANIGHRIRFLKSLFKWAQDEGFSVKNPTARLREPKTGIRLLSEAAYYDIDSMFAYISQDSKQSAEKLRLHIYEGIKKLKKSYLANQARQHGTSKYKRPVRSSLKSVTP